MKKIDKYTIIAILIIVITFMLLNIYANKTKSILIKYTTNNTNRIIMKIIDETISEILSEEEYNIIDIEKNSENEITNINFNNNKINKILSLSIKNVEKKMEVIENESKIYYISYGLIFNNHLLNNLGPKIPYMVSQLGRTSNNTYINIKEYGINNSMIEVILDIEIEIRIMLPFFSDTIKVKKEILLENKIIQGNIPKY